MAVANDHTVIRSLTNAHQVGSHSDHDEHVAPSTRAKRPVRLSFLDDLHLDRLLPGLPPHHFQPQPAHLIQAQHAHQHPLSVPGNRQLSLSLRLSAL